MTSLVTEEGNKDECLANAGVVKVLARKFGVGQWSFVGPGSEKKWYSAETSPQGAWDNIAEDMLLEIAESGHPTFRATTPLSRGQLKSKGHGKLSIQRSNAIILQGTLPAYRIPKVVRLKTGEVLYEKIILISSTTTKDLIETRSRLDQRE